MYCIFQLYISDIFTDQQLFIVFEFADGGKDVESAKVNDIHMYTALKIEDLQCIWVLTTIYFTSLNNTQKHNTTFIGSSFSNMWQFYGFLCALRFLPPIKLTAKI